MPRSVRTVFYRAPRSNDADSNTGSLGWVEPFAKPIGYAAIGALRRFNCQTAHSTRNCHSGAMRSIELRCAIAHRRISRFRVRAKARPGMTEVDTASRSRGAMRPSFASPPSQNKRAQGKPGARCTRGPVCDCYWQKGTRAYRFSGGIPTFPARWVTAYTVLSPVTGLSCHRHPREVLLPANLT